jgi:GAF domain-containing protein
MRNERIDQFLKLNLFRPLRFKSLKAKLIYFFLAVSLIPLIFAGVFTFTQVRSELKDEAFKLETLRDLKAERAKDYFSGVEQDIRQVSQLDLANDAYRAFSPIISMVGLEEVRSMGFLGNPNLAETDTLNAYNLAHERYYDVFANIVQTRGYADLLLVSRMGDVVYSYAKQDDFATNLLDGPYSNTDLADLFRSLNEEAEMGEVRMTDFVSYSPAGNIPVSFMGTFLVDEETGTKGILIYKLPIDPIDHLIKENAASEGKNEICLVGKEMKICSTTGFIEESIVETPAIKSGWEEKPGIEAFEDQRGSVLSAYRPIEIAGAKWILLVEQTEAEAIRAANELSRLMLGVLALTTVAVIWLGLFVATRISRPIDRLTAMARQVTSGNLEVQAVVESEDEIGQLAQTFNAMTAQLRESIGTLEELLQERVADLALATEMGRRATVIRDLDELLPTILEFIRHRFDLYYVRVYLVDDVNQNLVLRAGTGAIEQGLRGRRPILPINDGTIVGRVVASGEAVLMSDTESSDVYQYNPLFPETRSQLAVPLLIEEGVIGVLDMQDNEVETFTPDNLTVFEAIAVQLAVSISSAQQWAVAQEAQRRAEEAIRQLTREAWSERLVSSKGSAGYVYDLSQIRALLPEAFSLSATPENGFSVPLVVQGQVIGYLSVEVAEGRGWSEDEQALLRAVAQQLAQKVENLRLFEATQQRASREQIARRIIDRVRASRNIEMALRTATEELSKALAVSRAVVDLRVEPQSEPVTIPADSERVDPEDVKVIGGATTAADGKSAEETMPFDLPSEPVTPPPAVPGDNEEFSSLK